MLELHADNALDYLRRQDWVQGPAAVEVLAGGVSNQVLRISTPRGGFVLKQSRPQLRTRDAWFSDLDRIYRELEVMQALEPHLPQNAVPKVLFVDRANFVYAMSEAPGQAIPWKQLLLAGEIDPRLGIFAGRLLGRMHERSARNRDEFDRFAEVRVFDQLRIDPFYRRIQERVPEVAGPVGKLIEDMLHMQSALCHGDYTPKNMLVHDGQFMLVDYETAYLGEPAMDLGLFTAHLVLKAHRRPGQWTAYRELLRAFWEGYRAEISFQPLADLEHRGIRHLGACLLARVDGTSPVDYLPDEDAKNRIRQLGRGLLLEPVHSWHEVERRFHGDE